jgi:peptidyl-tRNA hydrolase, PTH1 family
VQDSMTTQDSGDMNTANAEIKVIVGLGNPGKEYALTRHNLGFLVIEALVKDLGGRLGADLSFNAMMARVKINGKPIDLVMPLTYMNQSGKTVAKVLQYYKIRPEEMLVVVDDMAIELGQMRLKLFGGTGGHNGLKSIQECIASQNFPRLRLGISLAKFTHVDHVLGTFSESEQKLLPEFIQRACQTIKRLFNEDFKRVAQDANRVPKPETQAESSQKTKVKPQLRLSQIPEMGQESGNEAN